MCCLISVHIWRGTRWMHKQDLHCRQTHTPCSLPSPCLPVEPSQSKAMGKHQSKWSKGLPDIEFFLQPLFTGFTVKGTTQIPITGTSCPTPVTFLTPSSDAAVLSKTGCGTGQEVPALFHATTHLQM